MMAPTVTPVGSAPLRAKAFFTMSNNRRLARRMHDVQGDPFVEVGGAIQNPPAQLTKRRSAASNSPAFQGAF
jgi:hypothetical protein